MTATQVIRFFENEDSTAIQFRQFNRATKDKYPVFTICLTGSDLYLNKAETIFRAFGLHPHKFVDMLKGKEVFSYEYNYTSRLYNRIAVDRSDHQNLNVEHLSLTISEILTGLEFGTQPKEKSISYGNGNIGRRIDKIPLDKSYITSDTVCFSRASDKSLQTLRTYDWLAFKKSVFGSKIFENIILQIFVHYPKQLMRSIHKPIFKGILGPTNFNGIEVSSEGFWTRILRITIGKVTILRQRHNANIPCDENLVDDDAKFQEELIKHLNCTPVYWKGGEDDLLPQRKCISKVDLQRATFFIQWYKGILKSYHPPCNQMEIFSKYDREEKLSDRDDPRILFSYEDSVYEEMQNTRSFDLESFVSGVGGFIGIFLGYSMLQVPQLLGVFVSFLRHLIEKNKKGILK